MPVLFTGRDAISGGVSASEPWPCSCRGAPSTAPRRAWQFQCASTPPTGTGDGCSRASQCGRVSARREDSVLERGALSRIGQVRRSVASHQVNGEPHGFVSSAYQPSCYARFWIGLERGIRRSTRSDRRDPGSSGLGRTLVVRAKMRGRLRHAPHAPTIEAVIPRHDAALFIGAAWHRRYVGTVAVRTGQGHGHRAEKSLARVMLGN